MKKSVININKGDVYKITVGASSEDSVIVWVIGNIQDRLISSLSTGSELILGPHLNKVNYRAEINGNATIEQINIDDKEPVNIEDYLSLPVADAVEDLEITVSDPPEDTEVQTIADKIDELLASLRGAGYLASE